MGISASQAPAFLHYQKRHIHLEESSHGPLSLQLLDELIGDNPERLAAAEQAAREAVSARLRFGDGERLAPPDPIASSARKQHDWTGVIVSPCFRSLTFVPAFKHSPIHRMKE